MGDFFSAVRRQAILYSSPKCEWMTWKACASFVPTQKERKTGSPIEAVVEVIDYYDKATGFTAMQRMTGWHISIIATMMAKQEIPLGAMPLELAVPGKAFVLEAKRRGFKLTERCGPVGLVEEACALMD